MDFKDATKRKNVNQNQNMTLIITIFKGIFMLNKEVGN